MNAAQLLEHYERLAESPRAVGRLRRFVLDLAIRGKLVAQDPKDESAADLLEQIASARNSIVNKASRTRVIPDKEEPPFSLPESWNWTTIADIGVLNPRNDASDDLDAGFVPMPLIGAEYGTPNGHERRKWGEIKKGYTHFADRDVGLAKITPCFENGKSTVFRNLPGGLGSGTTELHIVRPLLVDPDYVLLYLKSPHFIDGGIPRMTGTAGQKRVPYEYFAYSPFPLAPLAEQRRIVAKVDELMALCDQLEKSRAARETRRDKLTAATFARLNNPNPATFRNDARFALENLRALTTRPDQIKRLRQTILSLGVSGRLVPQRPEDESAAQLLSILDKKRAERVARKTLAKSKPLAPSSLETEGLPAGWARSRLGTVYDVRDGTHDTPKYVDQGYPLITSKNLSSGTLSFDDVKFIAKADYKKISERSAVDVDDILFAMIGSIGNPVIVDTDRPFSIKNVALFKYVDRQYSCPNYLKYFLTYASNEMKNQANGGLQPFVSLGFLRSFPIPVPPLAEQQRIATAIQELMTVCDALESTLITGDATRERLLGTLLVETLTATSEPKVASRAEPGNYPPAPLIRRAM